MEKSLMIKTSVAAGMFALYVGGYIYANSVAQEVASEEIQNVLIESYKYDAEVASAIMNEVTFEAGVTLGFSPYLKNLKVTDGYLSSDELIIHDIDSEDKEGGIEFVNLSIDKDKILSDAQNANSRYQDRGEKGSEKYRLLFLLGSKTIAEFDKCYEIRKTSYSSSYSTCEADSFIGSLSYNNVLFSVAGLSGSIEVDDSSTIALLTNEAGSTINIETGFNVIKDGDNTANFNTLVVTYKANDSYDLLKLLPTKSLPADAKEFIKAASVLRVEEISVNVEKDEDEIVFNMTMYSDALDFESEGTVPVNPKDFNDDLEVTASFSYEESEAITKQILQQLPYQARAGLKMVNPHSVELVLDIDDGEAEWQLTAETKVITINSNGTASQEEVDMELTIDNSEGKEVYKNLGVTGMVNAQIKRMKAILNDSDRLETYEKEQEAEILKALTNESDADDAIEEMVDFLEEPDSIKITIDGSIRELMSIKNSYSPNMEKLSEIITITLN
jgi:hypothetical protein